MLANPIGNYNKYRSEPSIVPLISELKQNEN